MSSLIFYTDENQALVATDTLATLPNGQPLKYTTKAYIIPHLRMIIAGTGMMGFLSRWFVHVNDLAIVRGISNLDYHAPSALTAIWQRFKDEFSIKNERTTTVYHFGFSEETELVRSFVYRSTTNFSSETLAYGMGAKPECTVVSEPWSIQDIRKMMDEQRLIQSSRPADQRIYIGGEIQVHHLSKGGYYAYTLDRFEDYDQDDKAIYENIGKLTS